MPAFHVRMVRRIDRTDFWTGLVTDFMLEGLAPTTKQMSRHSWCLENTPGADFVNELKPEPGEYIIEKRRTSAFYGTDLELLLRRRGIETLIFVGVITSGCVELSVRDARDRDFNVIVLSDCCADGYTMTKEAHKHPMELTFRRLGRVRTSDEVINMMSAF
jgi:nicotinamidase-related amidase